MFGSLLIKNASVLSFAKDCTFENNDILIENGIIKEISKNIRLSSQNTIDAKGLIVSAGLCDAHAHIFHDSGRQLIGLDPHVYHLPYGTTAIIDQGSSGANTYDLFRQTVIFRTDVQVREILNCSCNGMFVSSLSGPGELTNLEDIDEDAFVKKYHEYPDEIIGVKIRLTPNVCPNNPLSALKRASSIANRLNLPLEVHPNQADIDSKDLFGILRKGDIYTHAYHASDVGILDDYGLIKTEVVEARKRGVYFDTAHGLNSLSFPVLKKALEQKFFPDFISTDLHNGNIGGPVYDLPTTMSKFLCMGLSVEEVFSMVLTNPVKAFKLTEKAVEIREGTKADLAAFFLDDSGFEYKDAMGNTLHGKYKLCPKFTILGNNLYLPIPQNLI